MWLVTLVLAYVAGPAAQASVLRVGLDRPATLEGRVVDERGEPVPGASVCLRTRAGAGSLVRGSAATDAEGRFGLRLTPGPADGAGKPFLEVTAEGFAPSRLERVPMPAPSYDLGPVVLCRPVELRGRVTDLDGRPIAGAAIHAALGEARVPHGDHARRPPIAITDADGAYACRCLPPGRVTIGVSADGFADRIAVEHELARTANGIDFVLEPERPVRIEVTGTDGMRLAGAVVEPLGAFTDLSPWAEQDRYRAFWRGVEPFDAHGGITVHGLERSFRGDVRVGAPGRRPALVRLSPELSQEPVRVTLEPVSWIEVNAVGADDGAPLEIYQLVIRDSTYSEDDCGPFDGRNLATLESDSPAVERLAPDRWRVAWNGPGCYVHGGAPSVVSVRSSTAGVASVELPAATPPRATYACSVRLEAPARLTGTVRTVEGAPVALRLGTSVSADRSGWLSVRSDASGRFEFERIAPGSRRMHALDEGWEVVEGTVELAAGEARTAFSVIVRPLPEGRTGRVRGRVTVAGRAPAEPMLLALDEVSNRHLPDGEPRALVWTDPEGGFEVSAPWPRAYHILAKHRPATPASGWRDFAGEFPVHGGDWRWTVDIPESGVTDGIGIDLPSEEHGDEVAPP